MADLGAAILVSGGEQTIVFQLSLLKYILKSIMIIEINYTRHQKHLRTISKPNVAIYLYFRGRNFRRKFKSMESSMNMKLTHNNVD